VIDHENAVGTGKNANVEGVVFGVLELDDVEVGGELADVGGVVGGVRGLLGEGGVGEGEEGTDRGDT
jgi:hypothetical protein